MLKAFCVAAALIAVASCGEARRSGPALYIFQQSHQHVSPATRPIAPPRAWRSSRSRAPYQPFPPKLRNGFTSLTAAPVSILRTLSAAFASTPGARPKIERQYSSGRATKSAMRIGTTPTNSKGHSVGPVHSRVSGGECFCLDIPGGQQSPGLPVRFFGCNGTLSQEWELRPIFPFVIDLKGLNETVAQNRILFLFDLLKSSKAYFHQHRHLAAAGCCDRLQPGTRGQQTARRDSHPYDLPEVVSSCFFTARIVA